MALSGCSDKDTTTDPVEVATKGSLNVNVSPQSADIVVTGPGTFSQSFVGNQFITGLAPGVYSAAASADGYGDATSSINVVVGETSSISIFLVAPVGPSVTTGSLNVNVGPASSTVVVTGPNGFTETFIGNRFLTGLAEGQYNAAASAPGYGDASSAVNVVIGQTSSISMVLVARAIVTEAPRAVYRGESGNLISLDASSLQSGKFVFYAWLQDEPGGISTVKLRDAISSDPGKPLLSEQDESAPSFTQNLAGAWVGYTDPSGVVRPVIGADVRWEIDQWWEGRVNSMQFGTSDDNRQGLGYGVFDDQADTRTNNGRLIAEGYPLIASEYPLFNQTGIGTPFTDGFTWVTLFSPDPRASGRIVAVATINGEEIGKQIIYKNFAPSPKIEITKTVDKEVVNLVDGTATVTWTVTVSNVGTGDATEVSLTDFLQSGAGANYSLAGLPAGSTAVGDGFTYSFPLESSAASGTSESAQILGDAQSFAVLGNAASSTGLTVVSGDVGVSGTTAVSGFPPGVVLNGSVHNNDTKAQAAQLALTVAYGDIGDRACEGVANQPLNNRTFTPGVYCYDSTAALTGALVLDGQGDPNAEFIFKVGSTLTTTAGSSVSFINGASACNAYWLVGTTATLGANSFFGGTLLAQSNIGAGKGANISGRALSRTGSLALDTNVINAPLQCALNPGKAKKFTFTATVTEAGKFCNQVNVTSYTDGTSTWSPIDTFGLACFTALESSVSIIKDFVADDLTTSLGSARTVAASVPAKLRVRVVNGGSGVASGVKVKDVLTSGDATKYELISVSSGTPNNTDGFDATIGDIAPGATVTLLFTVLASADGVYCDTATVTATSGTIGIGSDSACLTVATPNLTITKDDSPATVLPGSTYTSTIVVHNTGTATASHVVISDVLGLNDDGTVRVIYVSSSQGGQAGTLSNNVVTADAVDIPGGGSVTFTIVSRIPLGGVAGQYCDTATVTAANTPSRSASDCVAVPAFSALQTQSSDLGDPVQVGDNVTYFSVLYVEPLSNEGVGKNAVKYSLGLPSPTGLGTPGLFRIVSTKVYIDDSPVRDPGTGFVVSDTSNPSAELQVLGTDYTVDDSVPGLENIVMTPSIVLEPNTAIYVVTVVNVPSGTPANHLYTTSYIWTSQGLVNPSNTYQASSSEPTTVLP
ncbi:MAG: ice-binding family protein [Myxococcota bacterium]